MTKAKEKKFLKDDIARKILNDEDCREYVIRIIALSLRLPVDDVRQNIKMVDTNVGNSSLLIYQETDVLLENDQDIFNIEINYNYYEDGLIKNTCYIANLMIRQTNKGKKYHHIKKIHQINIDNYDLFKKGKFIYHSYLMEETFHLKRDDLVEVIDINLDFLSEIMYTDIKKLDEKDLKWLLYIFVCSDEQERKELYQKNHFMRMVYMKMDDFTKGLNEMLYYDHEEFQKNAAYHQGQKDGIEIGSKEKQLEIAKEMLLENIEISIISKITKLSIKEIEELRKEVSTEEK